MGQIANQMVLEFFSKMQKKRQEKQKKNKVGVIWKMKGWEVTVHKTIGGLEWVGFSEKHPEKLLCISSQKITVLDCRNGDITESKAEYDEKNHVAVCTALPEEEITIAGQYGGKMQHVSIQGDRVLIETSSEHVTTVTFVPASGAGCVIFQNYGYYTCGFSYDGTYFMFAQDTGITIYRRLCKYGNGV